MEEADQEWFTAGAAVVHLGAYSTKILKEKEKKKTLKVPTTPDFVPFISKGMQ